MNDLRIQSSNGSILVRIFTYKIEVSIHPSTSELFKRIGRKRTERHLLSSEDFDVSVSAFSIIKLSKQIVQCEKQPVRSNELVNHP